MAKPPGFLALVSPRSNYMSVQEKKVYLHWYFYFASESSK